MASGFEVTRIVLALCQTHSVQPVIPSCISHVNQFCTECCLEVTVISRLSNVSWADWVRTPLTLHPRGRDGGGGSIHCIAQAHRECWIGRGGRGGKRGRRG